MLFTSFTYFFGVTHRLSVELLLKNFVVLALFYRKKIIHNSKIHASDFDLTVRSSFPESIRLFYFSLLSLPQRMGTNTVT